MLRSLRQKFLLLCIITFSVLAVNAAHADLGPPMLLVFGDSLVAGYGIPMDKAFPAQLEEALKKDGYGVRVVNAGVSGDTTSDGVTRLRWMLKQRADFAILELGANDMLRGIDPEVTRRNLGLMLGMFRSKEIPVILAGMEAAPNMGPEFQEKYKKMYAELAEQYKAILHPFFLDGVIQRRDLLQDDGMHPTEAGVAEIVRRILPKVEKMIRDKQQ